MKKAMSALCLLLSLVLIIGTVGALGAFADTPEEETEVTFEKKEVTAYLFSLEDAKSLECVFRSDLPNVPFINPMDYLGTIFIDEFTSAKNEDGSYTVTNAHGHTMVIDPGKDTVFFENYDEFTSCTLNEENNSVEINFIEGGEVRVVVEASAVLLDLAAYRIDVPEIDGKVYLPVPVIAAMFSCTYNNAVYLDGNLCFVHTFDPESYYNELDQSSRLNALTRTDAEAEFNYQVLCFHMDKFFGKPSNAIIADLLAEKGFDQSLEEFDEYTQFAKRLLLSENMSEYFCGLCIISYYCFDGGHTVFSNIPINAFNIYQDAPLPSTWYKDISGNDELANTVWECLNALFDKFGVAGRINDQRSGCYEKYENEIVLNWEEDAAYLIVHGDTAVFVFDSFTISTPNELKEALDYAKEHGVRNFILDDSCNGGGYVAACEYIAALITNARYRSSSFVSSTLNPLTGCIFEVGNKIDLNLDGEFDEKDSEVFYDFNFAVLTSGASFSCGNALPIEAGARGIMIIGEASGGGSCVVTERYLADGFAFPISDISKSYIEGVDYDQGAVVNRFLVTVDEEGNYDYSGLYDIDAIGEMVEEYYAENPYVKAGIEPLPIALILLSLFGVAVLVYVRRRRCSAVN